MPLPSWLSRFFSPHQPLPAGVHHLQTEVHGAPHRLHLRIEPDGRGVLIVDAATVLHLNQTAAEYAYHLVHATPDREATRQIARRYRVSHRQAQRDLAQFRQQIFTLLERPDLDPVQFIGLERVEPYSQQISAPYRMDCALTYRLPEGQSPLVAPLKRVERELTTAEWQQILDLAWAHGVPHILFTGGEPTLRDDLPDLIIHAEANGQVTGLLSDGLRLAEQDYLDTLLQAGLDHILIALQPENPAAWEALKHIVPQDLHTSVHLTLTPHNAAQAEEIIERLAELGVNALSLSAVSSEMEENLQQAAKTAAELELPLVWDLPVPYSEINPVSLETAEDKPPPGAGRAFFYVEPDGDVLPAQGYPTVLGNLLRDDWETIWPAR